MSAHDAFSMDNARRQELMALLQRICPTETPSAEMLTLVNQALTHVSSGRQKHHERLEFLGDAVLRLTATQYLDRAHPGLLVGECSTLRAQLVSDRWLTSLGEQLELESLLILGSKARGDDAARATLIADTTEALIGALFEATGRLATIDLWLTPHWQNTAQAVLDAPHRFNSKTSLQEWSQGHGLGLPNYCTTERSQRHGDPRRFSSQVSIGDGLTAEGWGRSRKDAEQAAANAALDQLNSDD